MPGLTARPRDETEQPGPGRAAKPARAAQTDDAPAVLRRNAAASSACALEQLQIQTDTSFIVGQNASSSSIIASHLKAFKGAGLTSRVPVLLSMHNSHAGTLG